MQAALNAPWWALSPCAYKGCRVGHRASFAYPDGVKTNTLTVNDMEKYGTYLVTHSFGFTMKYLKMTTCCFLHENLTAGQDTTIQKCWLKMVTDPFIHEVPSTPHAGFARLRLGPSNSWQSRAISCGSSGFCAEVSPWPLSLSTSRNCEGTFVWCAFWRA